MKSEKNRNFKSALFCLALAVCSLPADAETGLVNAKSGLSLRARPTASGKLLKKLPFATSVEILDKSGPAAKIEGVKSNWFKVTTHGVTGWVFGGFIKPSEKATDKIPEKVVTPAVESISDSSDSDSGYTDFDFVGSEKKLLKKHPGKLSRNRKSLKLKCSDGKTVELINEETESESYVMYYCVDYIQPEGFFLIYAQMYEGSDHFFVAESSAKTISLGDMPVFSPGRSRVAVSGFDVTAAYDYNGIKIFKVTKGQLQQEFEIQPEEWGPQNFRWESETAATFNQVKIVEGVETPGKPARLSFDPASGQWTMQSETK